MTTNTDITNTTLTLPSALIDNKKYGKIHHYEVEWMQIRDFKKAIKDFLEVYPNSVLTGALAIWIGEYYIEETRNTVDIDLILNHDNFVEFVTKLQSGEYPREILDKFKDDETNKHQLVHKTLDIPVDILSYVKPGLNRVSEYVLNDKLLEDIMNDVDRFSNKQDDIRIIKPEFLIAMKLRPLAHDALSLEKEGDYLRDIFSMIRYLDKNHELRKLDVINAYLFREDENKLDELLKRYQKRKHVI